MWGIVEWKTNKHSHNTLNSVYQSITDVMTYMEKNQVAKACSHFYLIIEAVIAANGRFIK